MNPNLQVSLQGGLDLYSVDFVQQLEEKLDRALVGQGFARSETSKTADKIVLNYRQFAVCL